MLLFLTNLIIKLYNAFEIHRASGKQASITKILLTGIFGIFSLTLTQLIAQIQEEENHYSDSNNTNNTNQNNKPRTIKNKFRRPRRTDQKENNELTDIYIDTNYKQYNTTIRRTGCGLQSRTIESTKKQKSPLPKIKYIHETFRVKPLTKISENEKIEEKAKTSYNQNITPPPAYQCLGTQPLPSAPVLHQQTSQYHDIIQPCEIPHPSTINQKLLIPTIKLIGIQNPTTIDFEQLKITATKTHNRSHSLDIIITKINRIQMKLHITIHIQQTLMKYKI